MTTLLKLEGAVKGYGDRNLLDGTSGEFTDDHKYGFIGRNGAGKSTMIRLLLGEEELDRGTVFRHPKLRMGYLRQHNPFNEGETVVEFLMRDSGQEEWKCGQVAGEFEIKGDALTGPVSRLSGGWQTRVKLTALLLHEPNLLLLDEPTNFLDLRTQLLLEDFLKHFQGGAIIVSHDRAFLSNTCDHTVSLSRGQLTFYPGQVDAFLVYEKEQREIDERTNEMIKGKREALEIFIAKNKANAATATQAKSKAKMLEKLTLKDLEAAEKTVKMKVPLVEKRSGAALRCTDMSIGYPEREIAKKINVEIEHGTRVAIVGDNGQGKTTFLRTIVGSLEPMAGSLKWGYGCDVGCYAQHVYSSLPDHYTVKEYLCSNAVKDTSVQTVLDMAGSFLFRGDDVEKPVEVLSGGERARLCMAGMLLSKFSVLILDEPGNHLDVETVEALSEALTRYQGTVIFTSHDRTFLEMMATNVIEVRDGSVTNYMGDYQSYLYRVKKEIEEGHRSDTKPRAAAVVPETEQQKAERKARNKRLFELKNNLQSVERQMTKYTAKKKELDEQMALGPAPADLNRVKMELTQTAKKLIEVESKWMELQAQQEKENAAGGQ